MFGPVILQHKVHRLRKETGNPRYRLAIVRPLKLLVWSPISVLSALYIAVVYGYQYLMFTSITVVFTE